MLYIVAGNGGSVSQITDATRLATRKVVDAAAVGAACRVPTGDVTLTSWNLNINTNLRHVFFLSQAFLPATKRAGGGGIANMGSITWRVPQRRPARVRRLQGRHHGHERVQSKEFGRFNVRINSVMPGAVATQRSGRRGPDGRGTAPMSLGHRACSRT